MHSALVMQDFETDSYWAIMSGESIAGEFKGTKLKELPVSKRVQWKDWVGEHPNTLVLSVNGREDAGNPYSTYFRSRRGFRGTTAEDDRLPTKEPIFAFHHNGQSYAVPHETIIGGKAFEIEGLHLFMYRPAGAAFFRSTVVYQSAESGFKKVDGEWVYTASDCKFNPDEEAFIGAGEKCPERFTGIDTFWYNWSLTNENTRLLE